MSYVTNLWDRDPAKWQAMQLKDRLEYLRKYHCVGQRGQSSGILGATTALDQTLKEASELIGHYFIRTNPVISAFCSNCGQKLRMS